MQEQSDPIAFAVRSRIRVFLAFALCFTLRAVGYVHAATVSILVHFPAPLSQPGVTENDFLTALETDFNQEFQAAGVSFTVQNAMTNYPANARAGAAQIDASTGYLAARQDVQAILAASPDALTYVDPANIAPNVASALANLAAAEAAYSAALAAASNLAQVPAGSVSISVTPSSNPWGWTKPGERWSVVSAGELPLLFPTPAELITGITTIDIDFTSSAFDPYRAMYDNARRVDYQRTHLINSARYQLGLQAGLTRNSGPLTDAMRAQVDFAAAEHFARDSTTTRYNPTDRQAMIAYFSALSPAPAGEPNRD